jgi:hypothetical protein
LIIGASVKSGQFNEVLAILFPLTTFSLNIGDILSESTTGTGYPSRVYYRFIFYTLQTGVFMAVAILIDNRKIHSFKGKDHQPQVQQRT